MRTSKFSDEKIIGFLQQTEAGMPIKEIGRKHGFSDASYYKWRSNCGGTVYPKTAVQLCIVHMFRHSLNYVNCEVDPIIKTNLTVV